MTDFGYFQVTTLVGTANLRDRDRASLPLVMASLSGFGRFCIVDHQPTEEIENDVRRRPTPAADPLRCPDRRRRPRRPVYRFRGGCDRPVVPDRRRARQGRRAVHRALSGQADLRHSHESSCTARELVERLLAQCKPLDVPIHLEQRVESVEQRDDGRWTVRTDRGLVFDVAAILLAAGNGAFVPQKLGLAEAVPLESRHVHYSVPVSPILPQDGGRRRRRRFRARLGAGTAQGRAARDAGASAQRLQCGGFERRDRCGGRSRPGRWTSSSARFRGLTSKTMRCKSIALRHIEGETQLDAEQLVVLYGLVADLGPIAQWGLSIHGGRVDVDTSNYESSRPGIFAVGDIANYPNKRSWFCRAFARRGWRCRRHTLAFIRRRSRCTSSPVRRGAGGKGRRFGLTVRRQRSEKRPR